MHEVAESQPSRRRRRRAARRLTAAGRFGLPLLAALTLAACGSDDAGGAGDANANASAEGATGRPEQAEITFGVLPTADYAAVFLANQRGFFKEEGLTVTPRVVQGGSAQVPGLVGGDLDISGVNWVGFLSAVNRGLPLRVVAEADRGTPGYTQIVSKAGSAIRDSADLVGKKVAVPATPGSCDLPLRGAMDAAGQDSAKVEFVELPLPEMAPALQRGGVDAACLPEPLLGAFKAKGGQEVTDVFAGKFDDFPIVGYSVTAQFAEQNPNTIGALQRALDKATALAARDEQAVRDILPSYTQLTAAQAGRLTLPAYPSRSDPAQLRRVGDLMRTYGVVDTEIDVPELSAGS
jgi:NitT/TauT family transport system substrate-binding protein